MHLRKDWSACSRFPRKLGFPFFEREPPGHAVEVLLKVRRKAAGLGEQTVNDALGVVEVGLRFFVVPGFQEEARHFAIGNGELQAAGVFLDLREGRQFLQKLDRIAVRFPAPLKSPMSQRTRAALR